jgi:hypothetical protein
MADWPACNCRQGYGFQGPYKNLCIRKCNSSRHYLKVSPFYLSSREYWNWENVNSESYCEVLLKLRDAIRRKRPGQLARGYCFIMTLPDSIQLKQPRRQLKNYNGNCLNIRLTARTWHLVTSICLVRYENTLVANVSLLTKRLKRRCGSGWDNSQKTSMLRVSTHW